MKTILTMILLSLLFSGCSQKVVVQKELLCYELQDVSISEDLERFSGIHLDLNVSEE